MYDKKKARKICKDLKKDNLTLNNIHELLNILKIKCVIEQEDPSCLLK